MLKHWNWGSNFKRSSFIIWFSRVHVLFIKLLVISFLAIRIGLLNKQLHLLERLKDDELLKSRTADVYRPWRNNKEGRTIFHRYKPKSNLLPNSFNKIYLVKRVGSWNKRKLFSFPSDNEVVVQYATWKCRLSTVNP